MPSYIGVRCPVCSKKFTEADDIVVCPVCGAPHHRDCYAGSGQCAFAADHLSGKEWTDPAGPVPPEPEAQGEDALKVCPRCNSSNPQDAIFCQVCGNPLHVQPPGASEGPRRQEWSFPGHQMHMDTISMAYGGLSPEEEIEGETVKDLARYVGSGSAYYLPRFRMIADRGRMFSVNLSALIFGCFYYLHRKMYMVGAFLLVILAVSRIPMLLYTIELYPKVLFELGLGPAVEINQAAVDHLVRLNNITTSINFVIVMVASMFSNRYYFGRVISGVREIRTACQEGAPVSRQEYEMRLAKVGGCNKPLVIVTIVAIIVLMFMFSSVLMYRYIGV